jgi:hypothetical protein
MKYGIHKQTNIQNKLFKNIRVQDGELVEKYRNTWKRYHAYYESSELAGHLAGTKKTTLELQNKGQFNLICRKIIYE